jgi:hypothetical protein
MAEATPQRVSALLRKAGFSRALNGFAVHPGQTGFLVRRGHLEGVVTVEHIGLLRRAPGGHLAELNRYAEILGRAGYRSEQTSASTLTVTRSNEGASEQWHARTDSPIWPHEGSNDGKQASP